MKAKHLHLEEVVVQTPYGVYYYYSCIAQELFNVEEALQMLVAALKHSF